MRSIGIYVYFDFDETYNIERHIAVVIVHGYFMYETNLLDLKI